MGAVEHYASELLGHDPVGLPEQRLLAAAEALDAAATPANLAAWQAALEGLPGDLEARLIRLWGLPDLPGLQAALSGVVQRLLRGDPGLVSGAQAGLVLGPLQADVGFPAILVPAGAGAAEAYVAGLDAPSGLSVTLPAGPLSVDGAVERALEGGWSGTLGASIGVVNAAAVASLTDVAGTASFAAILGASFTPGIQLGFGFEISTLGGVVGVNRRLDVDQLRGALSSGNAVALFFPSAPADAAQRRARLALLPTVLAPAVGSLVAGPAAELSWLRVGGYSLLRLSIAALLELPRGRFVLLGRAAIAVPVVLDLELDVLGEIDPAAGSFALDLAVVSGRLLGLLRVDGTAALRLHTADPAASVFTLGGFYPGYRADVPGLPPQRRLSLGSDLPLPISFRFEGYLAFTDGTVQAGARIEIGFGAGVEVRGFLQFDAIGHYDPFHIHAELVGGVGVWALGMHFGGVDFHGVIDGPGPVVVSGRVEVEFLGATAGWGGSFRLGIGGGAPASPPVVDLATFVVTGDPRAPRPDAEVYLRRESIVAGAARDPHVEVEPPARDESDRPVLLPLGAVTWSQTVAPFDTPITRARGIPLAAPATLTLALPPDGVQDGPTEQFAPAALVDVDAATLLTLPAYERMPSGVRARGVEASLGTAAHTASLEYLESYKDGGPAVVGAGWHLGATLSALLSGRRGPVAVRERAPSVSVLPESWQVLAATGARGTTTTRTGAVLGAVGTGGVAVPRSQGPVPVDHLWGP